MLKSPRCGFQSFLEFYPNWAIRAFGEAPDLRLKSSRARWDSVEDCAAQSHPLQPNAFFKQPLSGTFMDGTERRVPPLLLLRGEAIAI